jgi:uncharacterized protein with WD repeat
MPSSGVEPQYKDLEAKQFKYSPLGNYMTIQLQNSLNINKATGNLFKELKVDDLVDFEFSPMENYISTYSKFVKPVEGAPPNNNLIVWNLKTLEAVLSFAQKSQNDW